MTKRIIAGLLCLVLLFTAVPVTAFAAGTQEQASVDTGDVSIEGTNGFGTLLSQEIAESEAETAEAEASYEAGYTVTDLVIEGTTATVTYDSMEEALLVVALYTEDGMQMVTSATATVNADATEATVEFTGDMPEYFLASAYLVDTYDLSPLCAAYDTPMYTQEMQELLASTVEDYDADRVLNLDDDNTTNFAVYAETTKVIDAAEGVNTVASIDDENATYVIENADESITSLVEGDILAYPYETDDLLIVKIAQIEVNGTTVTIVGDDLELEEVFSHVKIESAADTSDTVVTDLDPNDGITYEGVQAPEEAGYGTYAWEGGAELDGSHYFGLEKKIENSTNNAEITIRGGLEASFELKVDYYVSWTRQYVSVTLDVDVGFSLNVDGSISTNFKNFAEFKIGPIKGVTILLKPKIELEFSGELDFQVGVHLPLGFSYENGKGLRNLSAIPRIETELDVEGKFFIGVDLNPSITVLSKYVASASASVPVGVEIGAELTGTDFDEVLIGSDNVGPSVHTCKKCLDITVAIKAELEVELKFLNCDRLTIEDTFEIEPVKFPFYWSFTNSDFGSGGCPYEAFRITVKVLDSEQLPISDAAVESDNEEDQTNFWGVAYIYLPAGTHTIKAASGELSGSKSVQVDEAEKVTIKLTADGGDGSSGESGIGIDFGGIMGEISTDEIIDNSNLSENGVYLEDLEIANSDRYTGNQGDSFINVLGTRHGTTDIHGNVMEHGLEAWIARWNYKNEISWAWAEYDLGENYTNLLGKVTVIADCYNKTTFDTTIEIIGDGEILYSSKLFPAMDVLPIDVDVTDISTLRIYVYDNQASKGGTAFGLWDFRLIDYSRGTITDSGSCGENVSWTLYSGGLLSISGSGEMTNYAYNGAPWYNSRSQVKQVIIEKGVTTIGRYAFNECDSLTNVTIGNNITTICDYAFDDCVSLTNAIIPDSVTTIGDSAFRGCSSLTSAIIPDNVITIGESAFSNCYSLTNIVIPDSVTIIGRDAFLACNSLASVAIPDSVVSIGSYAFRACDSLTKITVGEDNPNYSSDENGLLFDKKKNILIQAPGAISGSYTIPDSVTTIGDYAFNCCYKLTSVTIGNNVTAIGMSFSHSESLTNIFIPNSVTTISDYAFFTCDNLTDVYYSGTEDEWKQISIGLQNSDLTDAAIHYNSTTLTTVIMAGQAFSISTKEMNLPELVSAEKDKPVVTPDAVYPGDYSTEVTDTYVLKTASFTGLVAGEQYVLLAMKSIEVENPLAADNLLFIDQGIALEDGTLSFQYVQRETADISYVVACGASNKNLNDAEITFPEMTADGELQVVEPTVVYDGVTLTEGRDYVIVGTVDFTEGGTYICYIRGIHNYTGLVECTYTVTGAEIATGWSGYTEWVLTDDGTLTFSGEGNMKNYGYSGGQPWAEYADQITAVVIEEGVTAVGSGAFRNMTSLESVTLPASGLSKIGEAAFYGCTGLKELYIPDGVYTIWEYTFKNCTALTSIRLPATLVKVDQGAFEACTGLTELFIPGNTEIIGAWSYKGCAGLASVDMQWADATEIRAGAFKNCTALTDVILPADIQILGDSAFYGIGAASFTVPATVTEVGPWCFARAAMTEVTFEGNAPAIGEGAFNKITLTAFYPGDNATWTSDVMQNYGGTITWQVN